MMKPKFPLALPNLYGVALLLLISLVSASAQETTEISWEKIAPPSEEFSVEMPGKPEISKETVPYGQVTMTSTYYTVASTDGPLFMIASVSGMDTFFAMLSGEEGINAAADGFRDNLLKEIRDKGMKSEMNFVRDLKLNGYPGKEFIIFMGEIEGLARIYITKRKLYAVLVFNALKSDQRVKQFLDSFALKAASITVANDNQTAKPAVISGPMVSSPPGKINNQTDPPPPPPPAADDSTAKRRQPIQGGVLNGKAISLPKPSYPEAAREARASGTVTVRITIDENGDVISARAVAGHPSLLDAAVAAASRARFSPTRLSGQPVKVTGTVIYNFVLQ